MRCLKKAKENWIGERCSEIEKKNLRKNNNERAYQLVKALATVKKRESLHYSRPLREML